MDGTPATAKVLNDALMARQPGEKMRIRISRNGVQQEVDVTLTKNEKRAYAFTPIPNPTSLQAAIWKDWLRVAQ